MDVNIDDDLGIIKILELNLVIARKTSKSLFFFFSFSIYLY